MGTSEGSAPQSSPTHLCGLLGSLIPLWLQPSNSKSHIPALASSLSSRLLPLLYRPLYIPTLWPKSPLKLDIFHGFLVPKLGWLSSDSSGL